MQRKRELFSRGNENGSTILEVLVALFILSSLGLGAWQAAGTSLRLAAHLRSAMKATSRLIELDDRVRELAARVLPPYWARKQIAETRDGMVRVPYLDGNPSRDFTMSFRDGVLTVGDGTTCARYADFRSVSFATAADDEARPCWVRLEAVEKDGKSCEIWARFGGAPIRGRASQ